MEQRSSADSKPPLSQLLPFKSCFCEGRTASLVSGWIQEIGSVLLSILLGLYLHNSNIHHNNSPVILKICIYTFFVMMLINVLFGVLLLHAAYNDLKKEVGIYIKMRVVYLLVEFFTILFFGTKLCIDQIHSGLFISILGLITVATDAYLWLIVYSYYHLLKQNITDEHADTNLLI